MYYIYKLRKERWENRSGAYQYRTDREFMSFDEYVSLQETRLPEWVNCYDKMLAVPPRVIGTPVIQTFLKDESMFEWMDWYERWVVSLHGEEVVKRFGSLEVVDPTLVPVGVVRLFRTSRMKLDEVVVSLFFHLCEYTALKNRSASLLDHIMKAFRVN